MRLDEKYDTLINREKDFHKGLEKIEKSQSTKEINSAESNVTDSVQQKSEK